MAGKHVRVSAEKKSHATKRSFSSSDAKNISQQCQKIQEALNEIAKSDAIYRESIQQETNRYVATQVLKLMEKIPVEEVNRDKHGIRVKALRDSGYVTYADMLTSSIYQLAAIRGISEDGARIIKRIVSEAADKASTTTKLRLSADNRTEDMTRLITAVSQYQQAKPLAEESNRLSQQYSNTIQNALEDIKVSHSVGCSRLDRQSKTPLSHTNSLRRRCTVSTGKPRKGCSLGPSLSKLLRKTMRGIPSRNIPSHMPILLKKSFRDCWAMAIPCMGFRKTLPKKFRKSASFPTDCCAICVDTRNGA